MMELINTIILLFSDRPWLAAGLLVVWLIVTKLNRHKETSEKKKAEDARDSNESKMGNMLLAVGAAVTDPAERGKILEAAAGEIHGESMFKRALVDGVIAKLTAPEETKKFTPVKGSHPLEQLASRAVEAEKEAATTRARVKKGAVIALKILKGGLL